MLRLRRTACVVKHSLNLLAFSSSWADDLPVGDRERPRKSGPHPGETNLLGRFLADLRAAKRLTLRDVEEASEKAVSNAYLSQLENGHISSPHPSILHTLAVVYGVPYETLMEKAGYITPGAAPTVATFAIGEDLTNEEQEKLLEYLAFIRSRKAHE
jgi:HTH-type transcriptional regulator, competence development regulator